MRARSSNSFSGSADSPVSSPQAPDAFPANPPATCPATGPAIGPDTSLAPAPDLGIAVPSSNPTIEVAVPLTAPVAIDESVPTVSTAKHHPLTTTMEPNAAAASSNTPTTTPIGCNADCSPGNQPATQETVELKVSTIVVARGQAGSWSESEGVSISADGVRSPADSNAGSVVPATDTNADEGVLLTGDATPIGTPKNKHSVVGSLPPDTLRTSATVRAPGPALARPDGLQAIDSSASESDESTAHHATVIPLDGLPTLLAGSDDNDSSLDCNDPHVCWLTSAPQQAEVMEQRQSELLDLDLIANVSARREWLCLHRALGRGRPAESREAPSTVVLSQIQAADEMVAEDNAVFDEVSQTAPDNNGLATVDSAAIVNEVPPAAQSAASAPAPAPAPSSKRGKRRRGSQRKS